MKPVGTWVFTLEQSLHAVQYLILIFAGGKIELEDTWSLRCFHPDSGATVDDRAGWFYEFWLDDREDAEIISRYHRRIDLDRPLLKQILRANRRQFYCRRRFYPDDTEAPHHPDRLAFTVDREMERLFWGEWVKFMVVTPERRSGAAVAQRGPQPSASLISFPSQAGASERF